MPYTKQAVLPPKVLGKLGAINQVTSSALTDPLSPKKTVIYRGQTVTPDPALRGGDFKDAFDRNTLLRRFSGKFWSQSYESAKAHARVVGTNKNPVAVFKAETNKVDALKGVRGINQHNRMTRSWYDKQDARAKVSKAANQIRQGTLYETIQDPQNKRLSIRGTAAVNPTFKGVRKEALRAAAQVVPRVAARLAGPYAVVDMILNPTPAYNWESGYSGAARTRTSLEFPKQDKTVDPRVRRKNTIRGIR
jgi:hypothetical protein